MIDLVVVNYKTYGLIHNFLESYRKFKPTTDSRVILIDNESNGELLSKLDTTDIEVYPFKENLGYAGACNFGASLGDSEYVAFLNSDTEFVNDTCVDICVDYLEKNPKVGVVGPLQYNKNHQVTHAGIFGTHGAPKHRDFKQKVNDKHRDTRDAVTVSGSALFTTRIAWNDMAKCPLFVEMFPDAVGAFPPFPHMYEETLYNYHLHAHGYRCVYLGTAEMIHEWHQSSPVGSQTRNMKEGQTMFREFCDNHGIDHD